MLSPPDDLDLTQAQSFALEPRDLADLLGTVEDSLSFSLELLQTTADAQRLHRALHDLKGYLGLVAVSGLCQLVQQADQAARLGHLSEATAQLVPLIPRLERLQGSVRAYRAGIIDG